MRILLPVLAALVLLAPAPALAQEGKAPASPPEEEEPGSRATPDPVAPLEEAPEPPRAGTDAVRLPDLLVTASRSARRRLDLPYAAEAFPLASEEGSSFRTLPESAAAFPGVAAQKTSHGQGSPFIRGFTGFHTLLLVDGIRLNNSVFRSGPNQYWNTVDPYSLERMELVRGPSSVLYGSDAVGGTVNALTRSPRIPEEGDAGTARLFTRVSGAEHSLVGRAQVEAARASVGGFLAGFTWKNFGDLSGGKSVGVQEKTGYREHDFDVKGVWTPAEDLTVTALIQHVSVQDAWRTHKTVYGVAWHGTTVGNELKRAYDQGRDLGAVQASWERKEGWLRRVSACLSYQDQQEDYERIKSSGARDTNGFDAGTVGVWLTAEGDTPAGRVSAGVEHHHDAVNSFGRTYNVDGSLNAVRVQGPVGDDASYDLFGAFLQDELPLGSVFEVTGGLRLTFASARADQVEDPVSGGVTGIRGSWSNLSGSLRVLLKTGRDTRLFAGVSQGFRAPNLSDLTRLDTARTNEIETPSPDLEPETFLTVEAGARAVLEGLRGQMSLFYTVIADGIVRYPTGTWIGTDQEVQKANVGDGFVFGFEAECLAALGGGVSVRGSVSWVEGMQDTYDAGNVRVREWISKLAPLLGRLGVRWEDGATGIFAEADLVCAGRADKLSWSDTQDTQRIPPGGTPGYGIVNLRMGARPSGRISFFAAVENLFDKDYRVHGSGLNAPGTNLVLGVELR